MRTIGGELRVDAGDGFADFVDETNFEGAGGGLAARWRQRWELGLEEVASLGQRRDALALDDESPRDELALDAARDAAERAAGRRERIRRDRGVEAEAETATVEEPHELARRPNDCGIPHLEPEAELTGGPPRELELLALGSPSPALHPHREVLERGPHDHRVNTQRHGP